jgi:glutamine synthetase
MEMNTPDGFKLMNWETGYGDWIGREVWETTRVLPWLEDGDRALRRGRRGDRRGDPGLAADDAQAPGRGRPRWATRSRPARSSSSTSSDTFEDMAEKGYNDIERVGYYNEDYHLLQATKLEPLYRQIRNQMTAARIPIEFSKGEAAPSQHEVNIRYDDVLESADRSVSSSTAPRRSPGSTATASRSWPSRMPSGRARAATSTSCGTRPARSRSSRPIQASGRHTA